MSTSAHIFIDGEAGTTGLQIAARLAARPDLTLIHLDGERRKDPVARREALNDADVAILCLPDSAAREAVTLVDNPATRIIDASTAHRVSDGWTYGFPEYDDAQRDRLRNSLRIANPGCYALASIALLHPLVSRGLVPAEWPVSIHAVSGYSGGGKPLIGEFEANPDAPAVYDYALELRHKHLPEIRHWSGLTHAPIFLPAVGNYYKGMLVHIPLSLRELPARPGTDSLHDAYRAHYADEAFIEVVAPTQTRDEGKLDPQALNDTNRLRIHILGSDDGEQAVLVAQLDNLGKGASGQAVQTLNLLLDCDESNSL